MFDRVHAMRTRVLTSPAFDGSRVLAAILFEQTMERDINGDPAARYLWGEKNVADLRYQDASVINDADAAGISALVDQQFGYASPILAAGLVPIIEPEVSISSPRKEQAETLLHDAITKHVKALPEGAAVLLKITIPTRPGLYGDLAADPRVLRVIALSGGYSRDEACAGSHATPPSSPASRARFSKG